MIKKKNNSNHVFLPINNTSPWKSLIYHSKPYPLSLEKHTMTTSLLNKPFFSFFLHILFLLLHIFNSSSFFALAEHTSSPTSLFGNNTEAEALLQWKASLDNQSQSLLSSWVGISPCINWSGITCDNSGSVTNLSLADFGLRGTLYDFNFSSFRNLFVLDLQNNSISGTIPHEIGKLTSLFVISLAENNLTGLIPFYIGNLTNLSILYLWDNKLSCSIPRKIGLLESLSELDLSSNVLTGGIPYSFGNLTNLSLLHLFQNKLSSSIPREIELLQSLNQLDLLYNVLTREIPYSIEKLRHLSFLGLSRNQLSGPIPSSIGNLTSLSKLYLWDNKLSGPIPSSIGNLPCSLKYHYNKIISLV